MTYYPNTTIITFVRCHSDDKNLETLLTFNFQDMLMNSSYHADHNPFRFLMITKLCKFMYP